MEAKHFWSLLIGEDGHVFQVQFSADGERSNTWVPCAQAPAMLERLLCQEGYDTTVSPVARSNKHEDDWGPSWCAWCHCTTKESVRLLDAFPPAPTLVIREGDTIKRWALWALSRPLVGEWILKANERLSYRLKGLRRDASPTVLIPSPYNGGNHVAAYTDGAYYHPKAVVGGLRDAPERKWRR